jgi:hypothetical protein
MRRVRPQQVVFVIGVLVALFTLASGVVPALTHWGDTLHVRREVFINVPTAMKVALYAAVVTMPEAGLLGRHIVYDIASAGRMTRGTPTPRARCDATLPNSTRDAPFPRGATTITS